MLTPKKMKIIIASVSTVGLGAGTAGLVYGLTKKPQQIVVPTEDGEKGLVYLHTDTNPRGTTYNGTDDWYFTKEYERLGPGFAKRDEPVVENYKKRGWARVDTPMDQQETWREPTYEDVVEDDGWPVRPFHNQIAHLFPMYELEYTTFTFRDKTTQKELLSPLKTKCAAGTVRDFRAPSSEDIKHYTFTGWQYAGDYTIKINGKVEERHLGDLLKEEDKTAEFTSPTVELTAGLKQNQYCATFWLNEEETKSETIWADINEDGEAIITQEMVAKLNTPTAGLDKEFVYWCDENDTEVTWPQTIKDDKTEFKPYFESADTAVTIDYDGATWVSDDAGKEDIAPSAGPIYVMPSKTYYASDLTEKARNLVGADSSYYLKGSKTDLPNFYGWSLNGTVQTSFVFADITSPKIIAAFNNIDDVTVTFNSNGGYFNYENKYKDIESVTSISYSFKISQAGGKIKVSDIYKAALDSYTTEDYEATLKRDGFELHDGLIYGGSDEYSGWVYKGNNLPSNFEITESMSLIAEWEEKDATDDWWSDDWYTIAKLADTPDENATYTGTKLETQYASAFEGTDADGGAGSETKKENTFVGLQKEISLPQLGVDTFTVRVIGQGEDTTTDGKTTLLTIDFVDCPAVGPFGFTNDYVNDFASFNNSSAKASIISALPEGLRSALRTVKKPVMGVENGDRKLNDEFASNMFLLSTYEVNGSPTLSANIESSYENTPFKTYTYYGNFEADDTGEVISDDPRVLNNDYRIKTYNGEIISWWTRTPAIQGLYGWRTTGASGTTSAGWYVSDYEHADPNKPYEGGMWMYNCRESRGLAPAFCIGTYLGE